MVCGCAPVLTPSRVEKGVSYTRHLDIRYNLFRRSYRLHVPARWEPSQALPLVVVLHGAFETARSMEKESGFSELADRENFFVLYPNGIGIFGWLRHWNAGHCCGRAASDHVDDVGFLDLAIEDACGMVNVDSSRIYMAGFSNGGMLTHRYGSERSNRMAAIAVLAAAMGGRSGPEAPLWRIRAPEAPLPVIIFHGLKDKSVPYEGGFVNGKVNGREYLSVAEAAQFWRKQNGCAPEPEVVSLYGGGVARHTWRGCRDNVQVQLHTLKDWGHVWPGPFSIDTLPVGHPMKGYDAAEIIWQFFRDYGK
jgi:polyhydroxybutyrate depolymerase